MEDSPCSNDAPSEAILIADCGELMDGESDGQPVDPTADGYESYPSDDEHDTQDPNVVLKIATDLKTKGTEYFKQGDFKTAQKKYQKAIRCKCCLQSRALPLCRSLNPAASRLARSLDWSWSRSLSAADLDVHPFLAERDLVVEDSFSSLKLSLLLNSALTALKTSSPVTATDARLAIKQASRAVDLDGDAEKEQMKRKLADGEKAKCLYRRALGLLAVKEEADAIKDLEQALKFAPGDAAITKEWALTWILIRASSSLTSSLHS
jgi:peptidyl-prolyl isomerase D